jgi:hypothetical protein
VVNTDEHDIGAHLRELVGELDRSPLGERLRDRQLRRRHAYEALLRNPDPIMREIGEQLRDGRMRPSDVLSVPAYMEAFQRGAEQAQQRLDPREVAAQLESMLAAASKDANNDEWKTGQERVSYPRDDWDRR